MSITEVVERLRQNEQLIEQLNALQRMDRLQSTYLHELDQGLFKKRGYNLAPVNVLGASIPGQTTYKISSTNLSFVS